MKTKEQIKTLNFNEYAFFKGVSTTEAKFEFANKIFPLGWFSDKENKDKYLTKTGTAKVPVTERLPVSDFDFTMKSNSDLDGKCQFEYLCDYYNKGLPIQKLREFAERETLAKNMGFSGKESIIMDILNPEQLLKLQKTWLITSTLYTTTEKAIKFEISHPWALPYMKESGVDIEKYLRRKETYLESKKK